MRTIALLLLTACSAIAASIPGGREAWQKFLAMPSLQAQLGAGWSADDGLILSNDKPDLETEIPKLRAQLRHSPADAALFWQMSRLYSRAEDNHNESNTLARAIALYRQQNEARPENLEVLTGFGLALCASGELDEAEAIVRRAVSLHPKEWRAWSALAHWQDRQAWKAFAKLGSTNNQNFLAHLLTRAARREIPAQLFESARDKMDEAIRSAERIVELAPQEPLAFAARAEIRSGANLIAYLRTVIGGAEPDSMKFHLSLFGTNVLADLWRAAELTPNDPRPHCIALIGQLTISAASFSTTDADTLAEGKLLTLLSDAERRHCLSALARLQEISQTRPAQDAALALEISAWVKMTYLAKSDAAEADARRAIEIAPAREGSWDVLMGLLSMTDRPAVARSFAEKRVKVKDTARNRIAAAKTCDKVGLPAQAQAHVDAALKMDVDGYLPNAAALVLALKRSKDKDSAWLATPFLRKLQRLPSDALTNDQKIEASLAIGIGCVLVNEPAAARTYFENALRADKYNETAREALNMLAGR